MSGNEKIPEHIFVYQEWDWMHERPTQIEERLERVRFDTTANANTIGLSIQQARHRAAPEHPRARRAMRNRDSAADALFENGSDASRRVRSLQRIKTTLKLP